MAGIQPAEQRGTGTADVQIAGGAGGETGADGHEVLGAALDG